MCRGAWGKVNSVYVCMTLCVCVCVCIIIVYYTIAIHVHEHVCTLNSYVITFPGWSFTS